MRVVDTRHGPPPCSPPRARRSSPAPRASRRSRPAPASPTASADSPRRTSTASPCSWSAAAPRPSAGAPGRWEIDHVPLVAPVTKVARTLSDPATIGSDTATLLAEAIAAHPGPVFADVPMDRFYSPAEAPAAHRCTCHGLPRTRGHRRDRHSPGCCGAPGSGPGLRRLDVRRRHRGAFIRRVHRPAGDRQQDGPRHLPRGHDLLVTRARGAAFAGADLVVVAGTPLDFRLGYGKFGSPRAGGAPDRRAGPGIAACPARATAVGDLSNTFESLTRALTTGEYAGGADHGAWAKGLRTQAAAAIAADAGLLASDTDPIHPARIYGELLPRLTDNTIVIGDGGDFVSFAGRFIEPARPGRWLDPGPYGCLGTGLGYALAAGTAFPTIHACCCWAMARPGSRSWTSTPGAPRHPTVMVMGNNGAWGLEKHPMRLLHSTTSRRTCSRGCATTMSCARWGRRGGGHPAGGHRAGTGPRLRGWGPLSGQRPDRPGGRLPALHHRAVATAPGSVRGRPAHG